LAGVTARMMALSPCESVGRAVCATAASKQQLLSAVRNHNSCLPAQAARPSLLLPARHQPSPSLKGYNYSWLLHLARASALPVTACAHLAAWHAMLAGCA
jgi:hypothetical protein